MNKQFNYYKRVSDLKEMIAEARECKEDQLVEEFEELQAKLLNDGNLAICQDCKCIFDDSEVEDGQCGGCTYKAEASHDLEVKAYNEMRISNFR